MTTIPATITSCVMCDCGEFDGWHISIDESCLGPGMTEEECGVVYNFLVHNKMVETKEWPQ